MSDYEVKIVPYRGGTALLIDSCDLVEVRTRSEVALFVKLIEDVMESVDFVLVITSIPIDMINPAFRKWLNGAPLYCYRHITERGRKLNMKMLDEALEALKKVVEEGPDEP